MARSAGRGRFGGLMTVVLGGLALALAACGHREMDAQRNPEVPIARAATWGWGPSLIEPRPQELDPRVHNALLHERLRGAIAAVLAEKGFRSADPESADFLVEYRVGVKDLRRDTAGPMSRRDPAAPPTPGPALVLARGPRHITEGELLITLLDRKTGKVAYWAAGRNEHVTERNASEHAVRKAVQALLRDLE